LPKLSFPQGGTPRQKQGEYPGDRKNAGPDQQVILRKVLSANLPCLQITIRFKID